VDHPQQEDRPHWPTNPYPTPVLNSPLLATPTKIASYLAGNQEPVKYFQRLLWSLPVSDIERIEVICPPASTQGVIDAALNAVSYARRKRQRARERCLVLRTTGGNVRVLRAESVRDLQRWAYILTQAWAMYVWLGKARETVGELAAVNSVINSSVHHNLPTSTATSIHDVAQPIFTSTPLSHNHVDTVNTQKSSTSADHPANSNASSNASNTETDNVTSPVDADKSQLDNSDGERTYLSRADAMAHVKNSFIHITDEKDAKEYEHYKAMLQDEQKSRSATDTGTRSTKLAENAKSDESTSNNRNNRLEANGDGDDDDDRSLADSMRLLNGEHQRYSQQSQQSPETLRKGHQQALTDYSINAAILPAALMEKALDMADQEEAERKQRLQAITANQYSNSTTVPNSSRSSASAMITASGGSIITATRRTSRPTRTSSTGRVRRGLSTLRRERRPRRVEVVLVDGDDRVLTRSSSMSQNNGTEPKLQARVARIQSTKGVIIRLSDPNVRNSATTTATTATTSNSNIAQPENTASDEQPAASPKTTSTDNKYNTSMDSVGSDLKRRGAKRSPICFAPNNNNNSSGNSNNSNNSTSGSTSLREAIANRSRSNSIENPAISPRKSVSIAGGPRVHTTDVDVVAPTPRSVADTTNLQRCADILSHKPSDASIVKSNEKAERSKENSDKNKNKKQYRDHTDTSRRSSHYASEEPVSKHKDAPESEDKYQSRKHRASDSSPSRRRSSHIANGNGRWDDLDENWVDDDEDNWYDRRDYRATTSNGGHAHRRSYDSYHVAAYNIPPLHGEFRGPPMPPPPPPPPPMLPRHPDTHYPYYRESTLDKSVHSASYRRHQSSYDGMVHPHHPPYPYSYNQPYYQSAPQPLPPQPQPPRLSLGVDRSSTATFGNGTSEQQQQHRSTQMPLTNSSTPVDPYGAYTTELYPPPQSRRPTGNITNCHSSNSRTRDNPSGSTDDKENSSGRKSMRLRRKEGRS
jgi:hypothetical protein